MHQLFAKGLLCIGHSFFFFSLYSVLHMSSFPPSPPLTPASLLPPTTLWSVSRGCASLVDLFPLPSLWRGKD